MAASVGEKENFGRGGAKHRAKPMVDLGLLFKCLDYNVDLVKDLGIYEHVSKNGGLEPRGLLALAPLLMGLLKLESSAEIHAQALKSALLQLLLTDAQVNNSKYVGNVWATLRCERIGTVLFHLRRLARGDPSDLKKCTCQLTTSEFLKVKELMDMVRFDEPLRKGAPEVMDAATVHYDEDTTGATRALCPRVSDVSVDSDGFPSILKGAPATPPEAPQPLKKGEESSCSFKGRQCGSILRPRLDCQGVVTKTNEGWTAQDENTDLKKSMGFQVSSGSGVTAPAPGPLCKRPAAAAAAATVRRRPAASSQQHPRERKPWVKISRTIAKHNPRAYLVGTTSHCKGAKLLHIVTVTQKNSAMYVAITDRIHEALKKDHLTKEEAVQLKNRLLQQQP